MKPRQLSRVSAKRPLYKEQVCRRSLIRSPVELWSSLTCAQYSSSTPAPPICYHGRQEVNVCSASGLPALGGGTQREPKPAFGSTSASFPDALSVTTGRAPGRHGPWGSREDCLRHWIQRRGPLCHRERGPGTQEGAHARPLAGDVGPVLRVRRRSAERGGEAAAIAARG